MYKQRLNNLRKLMKNNGLQAVLLISDPNRNYMSGFTGEESYSVITDEKAIFITDSRFTEQARQQVKDYEIVEYKGAFPEFLANLTKELKVKNLGFEQDVVSYSTYITYKEKLQCELVPMNGIVEELRIIKDKKEVECIKKAAAIADKAFEHMLHFIKPGMTEREIGLELEFFMKKAGAKDLSFTSIIASGIRSSLPHGSATDKVVNEGEFLTLDFGCIVEGYCSDMTRTIVIGKPSEKMLEIYNTVLEAEERALKAIKPGISGAELDKIARDYITEKGYGSYFGHGLGHGVGRQIHEMPHVNYRGTNALKVGMVITDEPGIYIPDFGGVRIEDLILITEEGYEVLSNSPKELICI